MQKFSKLKLKQMVPRSFYVPIAAKLVGAKRSPAENPIKSKRKKILKWSDMESYE